MYVSSFIHFTFIHMYMFTYLQMYMHTYTYIYICTYIHMYILHIYIQYMYTYTHIYIQGRGLRFPASPEHRGTLSLSLIDISMQKGSGGR